MISNLSLYDVVMVALIGDQLNCMLAWVFAIFPALCKHERTWCFCLSVYCWVSKGAGAYRSGRSTKVRLALHDARTSHNSASEFIARVQRFAESLQQDLL